jgi:hypothetical protein
MSICKVGVFVNIYSQETIEDTAYEVLSAIIAKDTQDVNTTSSGTSNSSASANDSELATLHSEFMLLAESLRESVRGSREMYETCRVYLECRGIQVDALKVRCIHFTFSSIYCLFIIFITL